MHLTPIDSWSWRQGFWSAGLPTRVCRLRGRKPTGCAPAAAGAAVLTTAEVHSELLPLLRVEGRPFGGDPARIADRLNEVCIAATERLLAWTDHEQEFIDRLCDRGEIAAELLADDAGAQAAVREQPLLQWKGSAREGVQEEALNRASRRVTVVSPSRGHRGLAGASECTFNVIAERYDDDERTPENL